MTERRPSRLPLLAAVVAGVVLIAGLKAISAGDGGGGSERSAGKVAKRSGCVELRVTSSSEKAVLLSEMATAYEKGDPQVGGRCVAVEVVSKSSGAAAEALGRGWDERLDGPGPTSGRRRPPPGS